VKNPRERVGDVRILIVDDHAVVRAGIRMLLNAEDDFEVVGEAGSVAEAIFEARTLHPDIILIDIVMPGQSGLEAIPVFLQEHPEAKLLVLSMEDRPRYVREAFAAGVSGYVLKEAVGAELTAAIREVARGGRYVHPELGARLAVAAADAQQKAAADPLSRRENEVLQLVTLGHTNGEVAEQLFISVRTAEAHRARIMQKLDLSSRAELVRYGRAQGAQQEK
jgi:two-component system response regulator NreC